MNSLSNFGKNKFPHAGLLASSVDRGWTGLAAELRAHPAGEIPAICPQQMEITLAIDGGGGLVERRGNGQFQMTAARPGTVWLCPIGVSEDSIRFTQALPKILHLYVDRSRFEQLSVLSSGRVDPSQIHYIADLEDDFVRNVAYRIYQELLQESAAGPLLVEHLAASLLLHVVSRHSGHDQIEVRRANTQALVPRQLKAVLNHMEEHLEKSLSLQDLAETANLDVHQFAQEFRAATGSSPYRYLGARRLELAKQLLKDPVTDPAEVPTQCGFTTHEHFARAFRSNVGVTPAVFRSSNLESRSVVPVAGTAANDRASSLRSLSFPELTASIAHEVNQPLTAISTFGEAILQWLQRPQPDIEEAATLARHVISDARRASEIIASIREMAQNGVTTPERVVIPQALDEAMQIVRPQARAKAIAMRVDIQPQLPEVSVDRVQFQQVIINLATNAIQAMEQMEGRPPELTIAAIERDDGWVEVALSDNGPGIPAARIDRVFDGFYSTKPDGMGMGLAICRWIVEAHGGSMTADSSEHGARFAFTLPPAVHSG